MRENTNPEHLSLRRQRIAGKLASTPAETNRRLAVPEQRHSDGDNKAVELTYAQIVARVSGDNNSGLPEGASIVSDELSNLMLAEFHLSAIDMYLNTHQSRGVALNLSEFGYTVNEMRVPNVGICDAIHPTVDGYSWYRGHKVDTVEGDSVLVMQPWMQPWVEGGSPLPIAYTLGDPSIETVRIVASHYGVA